MGHYDLNITVMRLTGVFGGEIKNVKQTRIAKTLQKAFGFDFLNWDGHWLPDDREFEISDTTGRAIHAFLNGTHVGCGVKGDCFSYAAVNNYKELEQLADEWSLITTNCKDTFPPVFLMNMCEGGKTECCVVHNGVVHYKEKQTANLWNMYGLIEKVI